MVRPMKLIDRYLLRTLLMPLFYCLAAFVLIYIIYDLFDNLSDFVEAGSPLADVAKFYVLLLPSVLIFIAPVSLLLSVLYSLSQLTKNNELTAMRASGVSLYRLMLPFITIGFLASLCVAIINETVGPWSAYWTNQYVRSQRHKGKKDVYVSYNLAYKNAKDRHIWMVGAFETRTFELVHPEVILQREDGSDIAKIQAKKGEWLDGRWWFFDVAIQNYDNDGHPIGPPQFDRRREMGELRETPIDLLNETKDPDFLSSRDLLTFLRTHQHLSSNTIARITVNMQHRLSIPWTCFVVTLLGIPFGAHTGRKGALMGVVLTLSLFFGLYILINLGLVLGKKEILLPWVAAWGPNIIFTCIGSVMIYRMR
ncbi:MAG: YjgP/YjgQ family permease [Spartobacteria bacterium]|nr:YjgP/YjgQ family permease [Spartobacteria bacterium]